MKTKTQISFAVTAKLISAFVFATWIVQSLCYLNPKFQASGHLLWLYSPVCVGPGLKPECWSSQDAAHIFSTAILSLLLIEVGQLSVTGERIHALSTGHLLRQNWQSRHDLSCFSWTTNQSFLVDLVRKPPFCICKNKDAYQHS